MGYPSASLLCNLGSAKTRGLVFFSGALGILAGLSHPCLAKLLTETYTLRLASSFNKWGN